MSTPTLRAITASARHGLVGRNLTGRLAERVGGCDDLEAGILGLAEIDLPLLGYDQVRHASHAACDPLVALNSVHRHD